MEAQRVSLISVVFKTRMYADEAEDVDEAAAEDVDTPQVKINSDLNLI